MSATDQHAEKASPSGRQPAKKPDQFVRSPLAQLASPLLNKRLRINVVDGRVLVGDFMCMDEQGNIVLYNAVEEMELNGSVEVKALGQVLVPVKQRAACSVAALPHEKVSIEQLVHLGLQEVV